MYATGGVQRTQDLIAGRQIVCQGGRPGFGSPLINNEQYAAGGLDNVRGYRETEALGDSAVHCTVELRAPEMVKSHGIGNGKLECTPYIFYDLANLFVLDPLPGQQVDFRPRRDRLRRERTLR